MTGETASLARWVTGLEPTSVPGPVTARAKALTLDLLGSAVRARSEADSTPSILAMLSSLGLDGEGPATVMGDPRGYAPPVAALLNGALGHSLDFDDTHAESSLHPSAPVVPAVLAAGELVGASGRTVMGAIVAGYEVACRLGNALDPTAHYARGFHPTATAGTFGAAAGAAKVFGLDAAQLVSAFGVAGSQAAGSLQFLVNGAWNKRYQVGAAAMNGLIAASLARAGFLGADQAIEGEHGFLKAYSDGADPAKVTAGLGEVWETLRVGVKPYPSCRYTHAALDGLLSLRRAHGFTGEAVRQVEIGLHRNGIKLTAEPQAAKRRPQNVVDGQFSMAFTAAVALDQGSFGWDDYRRLGDPALEALADRIEVRQSTEVEAASPHPFGGWVRVTTDQGVFERAVRDPSGEPESFPDEAAAMAKLLALAGPVLGPGAAADFARAILALDRAPDLAGLRLARRSTREAASSLGQQRAMKST